MWSCPAGQTHQNLRFDPAAMSDGTAAPFRVGCHCTASSGKSANVRRQRVAMGRGDLSIGEPGEGPRLRLEGSRLRIDRRMGHDGGP